MILADEDATAASQADREAAAAREPRPGPDRARGRDACLDRLRSSGALLGQPTFGD